MNANKISPKTNVRMSRIKKIIRVIRFLVSATIIFVIVVGALFLADLAGFHFFPSGAKASFSPMLTYNSPFEVPAAVLVLAFLRAGLFFAGALILFWLLDLFEVGKFFTAQNVRYIKWLGWFVVSDWVVVRLLDAWAHCFLFDFVKLAIGLLILLIAWIMDEGRRIQEEQELTV